MNPEAFAPAQWAASADARAELAEHGWMIRLGYGSGLRLGPTWVAERGEGSMRTTLYERELAPLLRRVRARRPSDDEPRRRERTDE